MDNSVLCYKTKNDDTSPDRNRKDLRSTVQKPTISKEFIII